MKTRTLLLVLTLALPIFASAETVYKTRDAEGNIIFSDVPSEGAETIEIEESQTISIPKPERLDNRRATKLSPEETKYNQFEIVSPENDSTIRSNEGFISINLEIAPTLDEAHTVALSLDGKEVGSGKSLQFSLTDLDRGTHTVTAAVKNEKDEVIKRSNKLVFHLRKESKLFKNRVNETAPTSESTATTPASPASGGDAPSTPQIPSL